MALISRDPFAREEIHRTRVYRPFAVASQDGCAWCGHLKRTPKGRSFLYRYRVETDGGRTHEDTRLFCSRDCRESYHG